MATPTSPPPPSAPGFGLDAPALSRAFDDPDSAGRYLRGTLAAFSLVAAAIHFAFAPDHFSEEWSHGLAFVLMGWAQLAWGVLLITRPRRWTLAAGIVGNVAIIAVWVVSRTAGLPTWLGGEGGSEGVGNADLLATALEGMIVVGSVALLAIPALARRPIGDARMASALAASAITLALVGASVGINPETSGHTHSHGEEGHSHGGEEAGAGHTHGTDEEAAGHSHAAGEEQAAGHSHGAGAGNGASGDASAHTVGVPWETGTSPCELATKGQDPEEANSGQGHNHHGPLPQEAITPEEQAKLIEEQKLARSVVEKYPTVAAAEADGYKKSTAYIPCIGAHYTKVSLVLKFDPAAPSELLFDGTDPDSKIIGLSYLILHPGGMPDGFSGPNDVWHQHSSNGGLCLNGEGVVVGGEQTSEAECKRRGGRKNGLKDIWMVHDWVAPGYDCSWGVFAAECPELGGRTGGKASDPIDEP
jgi:hypothetical protein